MKKTWMRWTLAGLVATAGGLNSVANAAVMLTDEDQEEKKIRVVVRTDSEEVDEEEVEEEEQEHRVVVRAENVAMPKVWLGIMLKEVEGDLAMYLGGDEGVLISEVYKKSPAMEAGVKEGDLLLSINGDEVDEPSAIIEIMKDVEEGDQLALQVLRKGDEVEVMVEPAERPQEVAAGVNIQNSFDAIVELDELEGVEPRIKEALKKLELRKGGNGVNLFRFGGPAFVWRGESGDEKILDVVKSVSGDDMEVQVTKKNDEPAIVIVKEGDEVKEYKIEDLKKLPEDFPEEVEIVIAEALEGKGGSRFQIQAMPSKIMELDLDLEMDDVLKASELEEQIQGKVRAMIEQQRGAAKKMAEQARKEAAKVRTRVRRMSESSGEVEELRMLVEELKKEVESLRKQIDD
ncbi:MAG: PDZ domain-containing protein [Planctomycetota bacterium]